MILLIDGPDGSGKSYLAKHLAEQTGYKLVHMSYPKTEEEKQTMAADYMRELSKGKNLIFDRCWYSELVYGPIMRGGSAISYPAMYSLEKAAAKSGALIIYCTGDKEQLWKRCNKRGEDYIVEYDIFVRICAAYDEVMSMPHIIPKVAYTIDSSAKLF